MNDAELREHLLGVTAEITPRSPSVAALRRDAARRRRQLRRATASVGVLVIVLAAVGIGLSRGHSGSSSITSGGPEAAATSNGATAGTVAVPCHGGVVTVAVGQTLVLTMCPQGTTTDVGDPAVLSSITATSLRAVAVGTTTVIIIEKTPCQLSSSVVCPALAIAEKLTVTVRAASGSATTSDVVSVPCTTAAITLAVGQSFVLAGCPSPHEITGGGTSLDITRDPFRATEPGFETFQVTWSACLAVPGRLRSACAGGIGQATITVTVVATAKGSPVR